jgi:hypothetical protein
MKKILLIILLFISAVSFSQNELSGKFCHSFNDGFSGVCINFKNNNRFEYEVGGCLGVENFGKGKYQLKDNLLNLIFDKDSAQFQSNIKIETLEFRDRKDSIDLIFHIVEKANPEEPLPAMIFQESDSYEFEKGRQTNNEGRLTITKPLNQKSEKYRVLFLGLERFEFTLENDHTKKVTIELAPEAPQIISDKVLTLPLRKITPDLFITENGEEYKKVEQ